MRRGCSPRRRGERCADRSPSPSPPQCRSSPPFFALLRCCSSRPRRCKHSPASCAGPCPTTPAARSPGSASSSSVRRSRPSRAPTVRSSCAACQSARRSVRAQRIGYRAGTQSVDVTASSAAVVRFTLGSDPLALEAVVVSGTLQPGVEARVEHRDHDVHRAADPRAARRAAPPRCSRACLASR